MSPLRERLERFWFEPEAPDNLGFCRILFFALVLLFYSTEGFSAWASVSPAFWHPITLFAKLHVPVFSARVLLGVQLVWLLSLGLSAAGVLTRVSTLVAFAAGFYRLGLPHNFGKVHHFDAMILLVIGILSLSQCGDAHSVDAWLARRRGAPSAAPSGEYRWPIRAVWLLLSMIFCAAGVSKLRHGGLSWIFTNNMAIVLNQHAYRIANQDPLTTWGLFLARYPAICSAFALSTVVLEAGYPLALVNRQARWVFPPGMVGALIGIRLLMGPTFPQFILCHLFWVPWDRVLEAVTTRFGAGARVMRGA